MRWIGMLLLLLIAGCGMLPVVTFTRATIPADIAVPPNQKLDLILVAKGVQIYRCDSKKDAPGRFEWSFQAPEALLRDVGGKSVGRHYAGPTWEADDGSKIVGTVQARVDAPDKAAIPWLMPRRRKRYLTSCAPTTRKKRLKRSPTGLNRSPTTKNSNPSGASN